MRRIFEPLYFIKGEKKIPSGYVRRGFKNHWRRIFEPLYFIKGEKKNPLRIRPEGI
jgi:hypothetical protein